MQELPHTSQFSQARFHTTQWEIVRQASEPESEEGRAALEQFCAAYWYPLYAFLRRQGHQADDSADLVQGFFADFLSRDDLKKVEQESGRLRSYLLSALRNFASNQRARQAAQKRGGHLILVSVERERAEARYSVEPKDHQTPERAFERSWAVTILERALDRLSEEQESRGRRDVFQRLVGYLSGTPPEGGLAEAAADSALSTSALKVALHRLRRRYRELLRQEVRETLGPEQDVDQELDVLLVALDTDGD
ncbi:MAG: RNA polymerase sigma factor (sigma-70 family) [Planctomycetota bacterium]|jgi:RNA polymerase sigma factor (sigma-70 family)